MILISDIQFVIVLYKCKLQDSITFNSLSTALKKENHDVRPDLYVYDNSPYKQDQFLENNNWTITYISDLSNAGLSLAYNLAASHALTLNKKFILLLDQDTEFPLHSIKTYLDSINDNMHVSLFAPILKIQNDKIMSPCRYVNKWGKLIDNISPGSQSLDNYVPVNSGLCINLKHYFLAGKYNENVKVDGADFQFIERFKKRIGKNFYVLNLMINQDFSLFDTDLNSVLPRFKIFLQDVKNFERENIMDDYYYGRIALIRTIKLLMQTRKRVVFEYYIKFYLIN